MTITTIAIDTEQRDKLIALGKKGETYNQIIKRICWLWKTKRVIKMSDAEPTKAEIAKLIRETPNSTQRYHCLFPKCEFKCLSLNLMESHIVFRHLKPPNNINKE